jgi:hypothetical protein
METNTTLIAPDFSGVQDRVSEGTYKARIVDSKVDQWAGKDGKPPTTYIAWTMETFGEEAEKNNGRKIFHNTPIEGGGAFRLMDFYRAATGLDCPASFDRTQLHGCEVELTYGPQKARPEYNEVKSVKPIKHS